MRIQSRFKDYYDFLGQQFGQDPDTIYVREPIRHLEHNCVTWDHKANHEWWNSWESAGYFEDPTSETARTDKVWYSVEFVVAGPHTMSVLCVHRGQATAEVMVTEQHDHLFTRPANRFYSLPPRRPRMPSGKILEELIASVGAPVFRVTKRERGDQLVIGEQVPVLSGLGFPAIVSPEQMWQDIYSTITNVLRKNPDKAPPVEVANQYKIHAAGFDLVTSFRHPVNQKKPKKG